MASAPTHNRGIIGDRMHGLRWIPNAAGGIPAATNVLDHSAEPNRISHFTPLEFPGIAVGEPIIGQLVLPAIGELLAKQPMFVADSVAMSRHAEARHTVHVT